MKPQLITLNVDCCLWCHYFLQQLHQFVTQEDFHTVYNDLRVWRSRSKLVWVYLRGQMTSKLQYIMDPRHGSVSSEQFHPVDVTKLAHRQEQMDYCLVKCPIWSQALLWLVSCIEKPYLILLIWWQNRGACKPRNPEKNLFTVNKDKHLNPKINFTTLTQVLCTCPNPP